MKDRQTIDFRSDTVTLPTLEMREAMRVALVGDDVFGEDPSVLALEEEVADLLGTEASLFVPSGTMSNQIGIGLLTRPGEEVLVGQGTHCAWYESGGMAALWGVQPVVIGRGGLFDELDVAEGVKPPGDWHPKTSLMVVENTHNRAGGRVWSLDKLEAVLKAARSLGLSAHMDGARIWNAAVASKTTERSLARGFDTVSVCFSKGLGAPVGSALCSTKELVQQGRRLRKRLGGGMRQAGILAAAARFALKNNRERLERDHDNAKRVASILADTPGANIDPSLVETNILMVDTPWISARELAEQAEASGVLVSVFGPHRIRLVMHRDVEDVALQGGKVLADVIACRYEGCGVER